MTACSNDRKPSSFMKRRIFLSIFTAPVFQQRKHYKHLLSKFTLSDKVYHNLTLQLQYKAFTHSWSRKYLVRLWKLDKLFSLKKIMFTKMFFTLLVSCEKRPIMQDEKKGRSSMFFVTYMKLCYVKIELGRTIYHSFTLYKYITGNDVNRGKNGQAPEVRYNGSSR